MNDSFIQTVAAWTMLHEIVEECVTKTTKKKKKKNLNMNSKSQTKNI